MSETTTFAAITATASATAATTSSVFEYYGGNTPSMAGNIVFAVVFGIILVIQSILGVLYREWWFLGSWFFGIGLEIVGYIGRAWSSKNINSLTAYAMQMSCLTFAPSFLMAGIYYILAQLITIYGTQYSFLKPMTYSYLFIAVDVCCIFLQGGGGGVASSGNGELGSNIMLAGLILQVVVMAIFQTLWYIFIWKIYCAYKLHGDNSFEPQYTSIRSRSLLHWFIAAVGFAVILIFARSIYRVVEFAQGWDSELANTEIYVLTLDGLLVCLAVITLTIFYPGFAYGKNNNLKIKKKNSGNLETSDYFEKSEEPNFVTIKNPFLSPIDERNSRGSNV